jgi:hypothetical protein
MKKDFTKSANINPGPSKETFLHCYKESLTNNTLQENIEDEIITMEKLKEALKTNRYKITW